MVIRWHHSKLMQSFLSDTAVVLMAYAAMGLLGLLALNLSFLSPVANVMNEFSYTDIYYHVLQESGASDTSQVITLVDMTRLRKRGKIADVLEQIEEFSPKVVGVDIVFEGLMEDSASDERLRRLAQQYKDNVVYSYRMLNFIDPETGYAEDVHSFFVDEGIEVMEGFTDFDRTLYGGMKRHLSLRRPCCYEERQSLIGKVLDVYTDGQIDLGSQTDIAINFCPVKFRVVPYDSVAFCQEQITNHIVLLGATHELTDMHYTPLGKIAGIELLAYSMQTLLEHRQVVALPGWLTAIVAFFISLLSWMGLRRYNAFAKRQKSELLTFFLTTIFVKGILIFFWMALLIWIGFIIFSYWHLSINLGWGLASIAFLAGANEFCDLCKKLFNL